MAAEARRPPPGEAADGRAAEDAQQVPAGIGHAGSFSPKQRQQPVIGRSVAPHRTLTCTASPP